jgi:hypothetical protein
MDNSIEKIDANHSTRINSWAMDNVTDNQTVSTV